MKKFFEKKKDNILIKPKITEANHVQNFQTAFYIKNQENNAKVKKYFNSRLHTKSA